MVITHKLTMNLEGKERMPWIEVSQWDAYTRKICLILQEGKKAWTIPEDVAVLIHYRKPDGTCGMYDTLPNGEKAWTVQDHLLTLVLAPQVLTAAGKVMLQASLLHQDKVLNTFAVEICVCPAGQRGADDADSENYFMVTDVLTTPEKAAVGQFLRVLEVSADGKILRLEAVDAPETSGSNGPEDALLYTAQSLTEEQKTQARTNIDAMGKSISWDDVGEKDTVFVEAYDVPFTDDGVILESNGMPAEGDFVTMEFDGVTTVCQVLDMFGSPTIEAEGIVLAYIDGLAMAFAEDTTRPHSLQMAGKTAVVIPDKYVPQPYAKFFIDQSTHIYLCYDALDSTPITREDLLTAITGKPVIISLGNSEFYFPVAMNPYAGNSTYGSVTIMKSDGTLKTYYTSEYTA